LTFNSETLSKDKFKKNLPKDKLRSKRKTRCPWIHTPGKRSQTHSMIYNKLTNYHKIACWIMTRYFEASKFIRYREFLDNYCLLVEKRCSERGLEDTIK